MKLRRCFLASVAGLVPPAIARATAPPYTPATIRQAYGFDLLSANYTSGVTGSGQTIAIIDAYGTQTLQSDINTFDTTYGLPTLTPAISGQSASATVPAFNSMAPNWAVETTLDVEYAHAIAPGAKIDLIETNSSSGSDLNAGVAYAVSLGASVVSMSYGGGEYSSVDSNFQTAGSSLTAGVTFVASSGDNGSLNGGKTGTSSVNDPAASQYVVGVGGTSLTANGSVITSETAWSGSGGGVSKSESEPTYQIGVQSTGKRTVPDVAYDADPNTGVNIVYGGDTFAVGGTSIGAPQWAGLFALADQERAANGLSPLSSLSALQAMYATYGTGAYSMAFHDITSGSNGAYSAGPNYDDVTGLGSPIAQNLVAYLGGSETLAQLAPEPASATLLLLAFPALMRRRRR